MSRPSRCPTPRTSGRPTAASSSRDRRTRTRRRRSSTGSLAPTDRRCSRRSDSSLRRDALTAGAATRRRAPFVRAAGDLPLRVVAALAVVSLGLPVLVLLVRAVGDGALVEAAGLRVVVDALILSLVTTSASLVLSVALGLPLAYVLARRTFRGQTIVETLVDLPIVLPPSVAGLALLLLLGRRGLLGEPLSLLGVTIPFTTVAVILAQTFTSAPFFIRSARTGFATVDRDLEDAARVDGGSERQVFRTITVPLAATALAAGLVLTWAR